MYRVSVRNSTNQRYHVLLYASKQLHVLCDQHTVSVQVDGSLRNGERQVRQLV
jgi:hypothetical protein